jgi:tetratricopeptide (TPR) repeat protein
MDKDLIDRIRGKQVIFFVGAGISMIPPSCLPSWWQINHAILDAIADEASTIASGSRELADLIKQREADGKLPPEFVAEIITNRFGGSYFDVLNCLEGDTPNKVHLWLATLAGAGLLKAIITTNFDTLVERAFESLGISLIVLVHPEDFQAAFDGMARDGSELETCLLLKLHGTAIEPKTCVDTLAQRKKGLHPAVDALLQSLGLQATWLFLGYSGADLDAEPNYLGLRGRSASAPGFVWVQRPGVDPLMAVTDLATLYGDRGQITVGELPAWLDDLQVLLSEQNNDSDMKGTPQEMELSGDQIDAIEKASAQAIHEATKKWAVDRGTGECCIVLSDIAIQAGFKEEVEPLLRQLIEQPGEGSMTAFGNGLLYQELGELMKNFGKNREALGYFQTSIQYFQEANSEDGMAQSSQDAAQTLLALGYYEEAEKIFKGYLEYTRPRNDPDELATALVSIGDFFKEMGKYKDASDSFEEARDIATRNGLELLKAHSVLGVAEIASILGQVDPATAGMQQAIEIYDRLGHRTLESEAMRQLARLRLMQGDIEEGLGLLDKAKENASIEGNKARALRADQIRGEFLLREGKYAEAETILRESAEQAEAIGDFNLAVVIWQDVGQTLVSEGNLDAAWALLQKDLTTAEDHGQEVRAAGLKVNLGTIAEQRGDPVAIELYGQAAEVFDRCNDVEALAGAKGNIANLYYRRNEFTHAKDVYEDVLHIFENLNFVDGIIRTLQNLANVTYQLGQINEAKDYYVRSIQKAEEFHQIGLKDSFQMNLASVLFQQGDLAAALDQYEATYASSTERGDSSLAGMASYYAALGHVRLGNFPAAAEALQKALSAWDKLDEQPAQYKEVHALLQQILAQQAG